MYAYKQKEKQHSDIGHNQLFNSFFSEHIFDPVASLWMLLISYVGN
jgi:hypothetical protein